MSGVDVGMGVSVGVRVGVDVSVGRRVEVIVGLIVGVGRGGEVARPEQAVKTRVISIVKRTMSAELDCGMTSPYIRCSKTGLMIYDFLRICKYKKFRLGFAYHLLTNNECAEKQTSQRRTGKIEQPPHWMAEVAEALFSILELSSTNRNPVMDIGHFAARTKVLICS